MQRRRRSELKVGLVLLAALAVVAAAVFLIGKQNNLFKRKNRYYVNFQSVSGVKPGNPVELDGVDVGSVEEVILPHDPKQKFIRVWISVDRSYAERIRGPQRVPPAIGESESAGETPGGTAQGPAQSPDAKEARTSARIKTLGLLGDKYVDLTSGSTVFPVIPTEGQIPSAEPTNVDALIASGEDVMDNVVEISHSLSTILDRTEKGQGLLGELTTDSETGRRLKSSMIASFERIDRITAKVESGAGPLPRLLNDRQLADRLAGAVDRFDALLAKAQEGPGLLPSLLNDPAAKVSFQETLATLHQVAADLQGLTADLDSSQALLPRLLKDEEYGRKVTGAVEGIVDRLNSVAGKLDRGDGTAAKLINDPQIYDAVNDIIVGIDESRLLRWLIRNRQKAGIEKRYKETVNGAQAPGSHDSTPPSDPSQTPTAAEPPVSTEPPEGTEPTPPAEPAPPPGSPADLPADPPAPPA